MHKLAFSAFTRKRSHASATEESEAHSLEPSTKVLKLDSVPESNAGTKPHSKRSIVKSPPDNPMHYCFENWGSNHVSFSHQPDIKTIKINNGLNKDISIDGNAPVIETLVALRKQGYPLYQIYLESAGSQDSKYLLSEESLKRTVNNTLSESGSLMVNIHLSSRDLAERLLNSSFTTSDGKKMIMPDKNLRSTQDIENRLIALYDESDSEGDIEPYLKFNHAITTCRKNINETPASKLLSILPIEGKSESNRLSEAESLKKAIDLYLLHISLLGNTAKWRRLDSRAKPIVEQLKTLEQSAFPPPPKENERSENVLVYLPASKKVCVNNTWLLALAADSFFEKNSCCKSHQKTQETRDLSALSQEDPALDAFLHVLKEHNLDAVKKLNPDEMITFYILTDSLQIPSLKHYSLCILLKAMIYNLLTDKQIERLKEHQHLEPVLDKTIKHLASLSEKTSTKPEAAGLLKYCARLAHTSYTRLSERQCAIQ